MEKDLIDFLKERDVKYHTGIPWLFDEEDSECRNNALGAS